MLYQVMTMPLLFDSLRKYMSGAERLQYYRDFERARRWYNELLDGYEIPTWAEIRRENA